MVRLLRWRSATRRTSLFLNSQIVSPRSGTICESLTSCSCKTRLAICRAGRSRTGAGLDATWACLSLLPFADAYKGAGAEVDARFCGAARDDRKAMVGRGGWRRKSKTWARTSAALRLDHVAYARDFSTSRTTRLNASALSLLLFFVLYCSHHVWRRRPFHAFTQTIPLGR